LDDDLATVGCGCLAGEDPARTEGSQPEEDTARNKTQGRIHKGSHVKSKAVAVEKAR
jgi:hypothetical protein